MISITETIVKMFPGLPAYSVSPAQVKEDCHTCKFPILLNQNVFRSVKSNKPYCSGSCFDVREGR